MTNTALISGPKVIISSTDIIIKKIQLLFIEKCSASLLVASVVFTVLLIVPNRQLNDGDTLWHIILGQEILHGWHLPDRDQFSSIYSGNSYWTNSWFSDVLLAWAYNIGGFSGVVSLSTLCVSLTFYYLQKEFSKYMPDIFGILLSCWVFLLVAPHILSRPHVLVFPFIVLWTKNLLESEKTGEIPSLTNYFILFFWVNMHGSFLLAYVLAGLTCLSTLFRHRYFEKKLFLSWILYFTGMIAVTVVGPYGIRPLTTAFSVLGVGSLLNNIQEWMPQNFERFGIFEANLLLLFVIMSLGRLQLSIFRIAILLGLIHMGLSHVRNADYLAIIGSLILAEPISQLVNNKSISLNLNKYVPIFVLIALVQTVSLFLFRAVYPTNVAYPAQAIKTAKLHKIEGNIFNDYGFSGALIFEGKKVFIDSRTEFYSKQFFQDYLSITNGEDITRLNDYLNHFDIKWTILNTNTPVVRAMNKLANWQEIYRDDVSTVHVKKADGYSQSTTAIQKENNISQIEWRNK